MSASTEPLGEFEIQAGSLTPYGIIVGLFVAFAGGLGSHALSFWGVVGLAALTGVSTSGWLGAVPVVLPVLFIAGGFVGSVWYFRRLGENTVYRVYADRIEKEGGVLSESRTAVRIENVENISVQKRLLQKPYGVGSVEVHTRGGEDITIDNIDNPRELYEDLRRLVDADSLDGQHRFDCLSNPRR